MRERFEEVLETLSRRAGLGRVSPAVAAVVAIAVVALCAYALHRWWPSGGSTVEYEPATQGAASSAPPRASVATSDGDPLAVHVVGSVMHPGLYRLPPGSRVSDAVEAAGGALGDARVDLVNIARRLVDGEQVAVPSSDDAASPIGLSPAGGQAAASQPVDINSADAAALDTLPGIGPATAARIVEDRDANGSYSSLEDLGRVSGIGPKKLEQLQGLACVR